MLTHETTFACLTLATSTDTMVQWSVRSAVGRGLAKWAMLQDALLCLPTASSSLDWPFSSLHLSFPARNLLREPLALIFYFIYNCLFWPLTSNCFRVGLFNLSVFHLVISVGAHFSITQWFATWREEGACIGAGPLGLVLMYVECVC